MKKKTNYYVEAYLSKCLLKTHPRLFE